MKGRNPTKVEQYHMDKVQQLGCIVCRNAHMKVLPLCYEHHRSGIDCERYTSRHPFKAKFVSRYGTEEELLEQVEKIL